MTDSSSEERNMEDDFVPDPSWFENMKRNIVIYLNNLLKPCGSSEELLEILDQLEYHFSYIMQEYKEQFEVEIKQSKDALISNVFIRHAVMDVRISTAACISEIFRILAPCDPYEEDQMREFFQIAVSSFESLPCLSGRAYTKSVSILSTIACSESCVLMLDLQMHDLVHKMFRLFLNGIRASHSDRIFSDMECIMTLIIRDNDDCDDSAVEIAKILLTSLKKENQNVSPVAFRLAESAFGKCSNDLKPYLSEARGSLGLPLEDYGEVVVSLYRHATTPSEDMTTATVPEQEVQPEEVPIRAKRTRKPNTLMKYEEGYHPLWMLASCSSMMANSSCGNKKRKKSGHPKKHMMSKESHLSTRPSSAPISQKEDIQRKESFSKMHVEEKTCGNNTVSEELEGDIIAKNDLKNRQESAIKKGKGKSVITEDHTEDVYVKALVPMPKPVSSKLEAPPGEFSSLLHKSKNTTSKQQNDLENRQESSIKKTKGKSVITEDHTEDVYVKALVPMPKPVSSKGESPPGEFSSLLHKSKNTTSKQQASKVRDMGKCFGDELVGSRVKIWWPLDEMFYVGKIIYFDHSTKKHRVAYDDGDTEILDLAVECWEFIGGNASSRI